MDISLPKTKKEFLSLYLLKTQLVGICRQYNLPTTGAKANLTNYIANYIENKPVIKVTNRKTKNRETAKSILKDSVIEVDYCNDKNHRAFFIKEIGFQFKFNVPFMKWINDNKGKKTYKDAIRMWEQIENDKKDGKKQDIGIQFEYNQYMRDFFAKNPKLSRNDCIKCWNYKKIIPGKHKYSKDDLVALS